MGYTRNIIEIMRGIYPIGNDVIIDVISSHHKCEELYRDIFTVYGLEYNAATIKQKRAFITAATEYFILKRCEDIQYPKEDKVYSYTKKAVAKKSINNVINTYFQIRETSTSSEDLKKKYAAFYNEEVKDFSEVISINREDTLSDFAKAIEQLYYYKDKNN